MKAVFIFILGVMCSFASIAEEGGAPGNICLTESGLVVTTHLDTCPKTMTKL
ncbi:hypothetical protein [Vibrio mediterranei]|uniref:hypothetical protein n=1 Tax=Vibrio mediterranei TaxID=689 RepID=UPI00148E56B6|nr:hypothetical protein [Vibrio mediterranei]